MSEEAKLKARMLEKTLEENRAPDEFVLKEPWHQLIDFYHSSPHFALNEENLKRALKGHYQKNIAIIGILIRGTEFTHNDTFHSISTSFSSFPSQVSEFNSIKPIPQPGIFLIENPIYSDKDKIMLLTIGLKGIPGEFELNKKLSTLLTLLSSFIISNTSELNQTDFFCQNEIKEFEGFEIVEAPYGNLMVFNDTPEKLNENVIGLFKSVVKREADEEDLKTLILNSIHFNTWSPLEWKESNISNPFKIFGKELNCADFLNLVNSYVDYFNENDLNYERLSKAKEKIHLNSILKKSLWIYCDEMESIYKSNFLSESSLYAEHLKAEEKAKEAFTAGISELEDEVKNPFFELLQNYILKEFSIFQNLNLATKEEFASQVVKMSEKEFVKEFLSSLSFNETAFVEKAKFNTSFGLDSNYVLKLLEEKFKDQSWDEGEFEEILQLVTEKFEKLKEEFWKLNQVKMADAEEEIKQESEKSVQFYVEALENEFAYYEREWRVKEYCEIMHKKTLRLFSYRVVRICAPIYYIGQYTDLDAKLGEIASEFKERNLSRLDKLEIEAQRTAELCLKSFEENFSVGSEKIPIANFIVEFGKIKKKNIKDLKSETGCFYETFLLRIKLAELINSSFLPLANNHSYFTNMSQESALEFTLQHYLGQLRELENSQAQELHSFHDVELVKKLFDILRAETSEIIGYFIEKIRFDRSQIHNFEAKVKGNYYAAVERWTLVQNDKRLLGELEKFLTSISLDFMNELNGKLDEKMINSIRELTLACEELKQLKVKVLEEKCGDLNMNALEVEQAAEDLMTRLEAKEREAVDKVQTMILYDFTEVSKGRQMLNFGYHLVGDLLYSMGNCLKIVGFMPLFIVAVSTLFIAKEIEVFFMSRRQRHRYHLNNSGFD